MAKTYKALSAILSYPQEDLRTAIPQIRDVLSAEALLPKAVEAAVDGLLVEIQTSDLIDLQERYVDLFDRSRRLSLHLFEHVHGDSRDRGQALLDLAAVYESSGLSVAAGELPDYLPLFLEYLSVVPRDEARKTLGDTVHILETLRAALLARGSLYGAAFEALLVLAGQAQNTGLDQDTGLDANINLETPPQDGPPEDLDALWAEEAVTFGPPQGAEGCSSERVIRKIRAGRRDVRLNA